MQKKIRVGAVSYLNTKPLIYGFEQGNMMDQIELYLDYPSKLTTLLQRQEIDIALLPIASIPEIENAIIFSEYCIGSLEQVASVSLFSQVPIDEIQEIYLDYQSKTSVALCKILIRDYWKIRPLFHESDEHYISEIKGKKAGIIIGDRALQQNNHFPYVYDLAAIWKLYTQLPFVFATWISTQELSPQFISAFNAANSIGLNHIDDIIATVSFPEYDLKKYYTENICYHLDEQMRKGMQLFLNLLKTF